MWTDLTIGHPAARPREDQKNGIAIAIRPQACDVG
jgi:hypothetical protein